MSLERTAYKALEEIVGVENISEEPVILDSYAYQMFADTPDKPDRFALRPEVVLLPDCTEAVQAIVKICNRFKIRYKALSTGWGLCAGPGTAGVIQLDMRRMNRILEINEKNMYAVLEPYVIGAQLQAELMKHGLTCQIIGGGSNTSSFPIANVIGDGYSSVSTGLVGRNTLGIEWVLPTGEVVRLGSAGCGAGWFSGDGPGPSLRALVRGINATEGGIGVFTRAAVKVYNWPGPAVPPEEITGVSPQYRMKQPSTVHLYYPVFPTWEKLKEAGKKIAESEIAFILASIPEFQIAADIATSNEEGDRLFSKILEESNGQPALLVILRANSMREFSFQEKVLKQILSETGGECMPIMENDHIQGPMAWRFTRVCAQVRQWARFTGGTIGLTSLSNWSILDGIRGEASRSAMIKHEALGRLFEDGGDGGYNTISEYGHIGMNAFGTLYDPTDPEAVKAMFEARAEFLRHAQEKYNYIVPVQGDAAEHDVLGPQQWNYHLMQRKIKNALDPKITSDPSNYILPE
jgi:glycolate oxidase